MQEGYGKSYQKFLYVQGIRSDAREFDFDRGKKSTEKGLGAVCDR